MGRESVSHAAIDLGFLRALAQALVVIGASVAVVLGGLAQGEAMG